MHIPLWPVGVVLLESKEQLFDSLITILHFGFYYNRLGVEGGLREPPIPSKRLKVGRR